MFKRKDAKVLRKERKEKIKMSLRMSFETMKIYHHQYNPVHLRSNFQKLNFFLTSEFKIVSLLLNRLICFS